MKRLSSLLCTVLLCGALSGCAYDYYGPPVSGGVAVSSTGVYSGGLSVGTYYATPFVVPVLPPLWVPPHRHYRPAYRPPPPRPHGPVFRPGPPPRPHAPALRPGHRPGPKPPVMNGPHRPGHRPPALRPGGYGSHRPPAVRPDSSGFRPTAPAHRGGRPYTGHGGPRYR